MSNLPFITITELCNEVVERDREAQADITEARQTQESAMQNLVEDYEILIEDQRAEIESLHAEMREAESKLDNAFEDIQYMEDEMYNMNQDLTEASETLETMMCEYEVIGLHDVTTFADWADNAYETMRKLTNQFPVIHHAPDYFAAYEDAYYDVLDMDVDWDDSYYVEDYHDDRWQEEWNENAVEYFDTQEA